MKLKKIDNNIRKEIESYLKPNNFFESHTSALQKLGEHWYSAKLLADFILGNIPDTWDIFQSCQAGFNSDKAGNIIDCAFYPCTGGAVYIDNDINIVISPEKIPSFSPNGSDGSDGSDVSYIRYTIDSYENLSNIGFHYFFDGNDLEMWEFFKEYHGISIINDYLTNGEIDEKIETVKHYIKNNARSPEMNISNYHNSYQDDMEEIYREAEINSQINKLTFWDILFGRIPNSEVLQALPISHILKISKYKKCFKYLLNLKDLPVDEIHTVQACIDVIEKCNGDKNLINSIFSNYDNWEDCIFHINDINFPRLQLIKKSGKNEKFVKALKKIPLTINIEKLTVEETVKLSLQYTEYNNVRIPEVAEIAEVLGMGQNNFESYQEWIEKHPNKIDVDYIPRDIIKRNNGFVASVMDRGDYRAPLLGIYTGCCQHINGVGSSCAEYGYLSPMGGFICIEKNNKIYAQSFIWRNESVLFIDNIEGNKLNEDNSQEIMELYFKLANSFVGRLGIERVVLGGTYNKIARSCYENLPQTDDFETAKKQNFYSDARSKTYLLAGKKK